MFLKRRVDNQYFEVIISSSLLKVIDNFVQTRYNKQGVADMAQSVEHVLGKDGVTGSNPVISSKGTTFLG